MTFLKTRRAGLAMLALLAAASPAVAGWSSLGAMPAPRREANALVFKNDQGTVAVSALSPDIVRVRFSPTAAFGRDHSYAVVKTDFGDPRASFDIGTGSSTLTTAALK